jgi:adenylosuccinate lyase
MPDFDTYLSPFTWRYGSKEMRLLWSETNKRLIWRRLWLTLAEVQAEFGLVRADQIEDLRLHLKDINISRALEIEKETQHDLMAELETFVEQCPVGGGIIHFGATSSDIEDNADALRLREGLAILLKGLSSLLLTLGDLIKKWADTPVMAFTHLQPAEPSTLGYRLAFYGQDLLLDFKRIKSISKQIKGKGFKGAVGTSGAFSEIVGDKNLVEFDNKLSQKLDLEFFPVSSQVYPRKQDYEIVSALAGLGASLHKLAFDIRFLQSPNMRELAEPFGEKQIGSSAMPFKRNPIRSEKINSLARYMATLPRIAWDNAANSLLERTLDDSANRRILLPESCLAADEILLTTRSIIENLQIDQAAIAHNLAVYGPFASTERVFVSSIRAGADRQKIHTLIRSHTLNAWQTLKEGQENPLTEDLCKEKELTKYLSKNEIRRLMTSKSSIGDAPERAKNLADDIQRVVANN